MVAGHIMGASLVLVEMHGPLAVGGGQPAENPQSEIRNPQSESIRFLFSGDRGHYDQPIVKDPAPPPDCDYLMCESTYGNRLHGDIDLRSVISRKPHQAIERMSD